MYLLILMIVMCFTIAPAEYFVFHGLRRIAVHSSYLSLLRTGWYRDESA